MNKVKWWLVAGGIAAIVVGGLLRLHLETDILATLPGEVPEVRALKLLRDGFSGGNDLIIAMQAADDASAADAAAALVARLKARKDLVADVHWAQPLEQQAESGAALLAWAVQNADPAKLKAWQKSIEGSAAQDRLGRALKTVATSLDAEKVQRASYDPLGLLENLDTTAMGALEGSMFGLVSEDGLFRMLLVTPAQEVSNYKTAKKWLNQISSEVALWRKNGGDDSTVIRYTGEPAFQAEIGAGIEKDMSGTIGKTEVMITLLFWIMYRRLKPMLWIQLLLALSMAIGMGLGGLLVGKLSIMSLGFAAIVLGIIVDYAALIIQEARQHPHLSASELRRLATPGIVAGAVTTATVFLCLLFSGLPGLSEMGLLVALGVIAGMAVMLYFVPKFAAGRQAPEPQPVDAGKPPGHAFAMLGTLALVLGGAAIFAIKGMPVFETNAEALRPSKSEAFDTFQWIQERLGKLNEGSVPVLITAPVNELRQRSEALHAAMIAAEKDGIVVRHSVPTPLITDLPAQMANKAVIEWLIQEQPRLEKAMDDAGFTENAMALLRGVTKVWRPALSQSWPQTAAASAAAPILGRMLAAGSTASDAGLEDGHGVALASVSVPGTPDRPNPEKLDALLRRLDALPGTWAAGWEMLGGALSKLVRRDLNHQLVPVCIILALTLLFTFKSLRDLVLAVALLAGGLGALAATMAAFGVAWNLASLAAIPLLLGTGIDYGIHMMLALKRTGNDIRGVSRTTGRAVFFAGTTTVIGFASLFFAGNRGISSLGLACCLGTFWIMLIALWLLPHWRAWLFGGQPKRP